MARPKTQMPPTPPTQNSSSSSWQAGLTGGQEGRQVDRHACAAPGEDGCALLVVGGLLQHTLLCLKQQQAAAAGSSSSSHKVPGSAVCGMPRRGLPQRRSHKRSAIHMGHTGSCG